MELTNEQIDGVLNAVVGAEFIAEIALSRHPEVRKTDAEYWIKEAEKAWIQNPAVAKNDEAIRTILNISPRGFPERTTLEPKREIVSDKLPIPKDPDFEYKHLPADFTTLTDIEIRRYSSHNQHFLNRARYLLAQVINHLADANHLKDDAYRKAYRETYEQLDSTVGKPTKDLVDSYAREDEFVKKYDNDAKEAQANITSLKALVEVYSGNVERLSREWTMRQNEWEKGR